MILPIFVSKHQNKAKFKNRDDPEVLISDFPGLRTSAASTVLNNLRGLNDLYSFISSIEILLLMVGYSLATK